MSATSTSSESSLMARSASDPSSFRDHIPHKERCCQRHRRLICWRQCRLQPSSGGFAKSRLIPTGSCDQNSAGSGRIFVCRRSRNRVAHRSAEWSHLLVAKMHADELDIDAGLVHRLLRSQFPRWADLPIERLASGGTVNAVYRLGDELTVRLPLTEGGVKDLEREACWLPRLAPTLPVTIPTVVGAGAPGEGYPWVWAVHRWIDGETPVEGHLGKPELLVPDLAEFVTALRKTNLNDGPNAYRGVPLATVDAHARAAIEDLRRTDETIDADTAMAAWNEALAAPPWTAAPCWVHSDLMPNNLLVTADRLTAVLDFATIGVGDPACDVIPAWNLLPAPARQTFRDNVNVDDATWTRGRGWALSMAVGQLPYYRNTNPIISANARHVIREILTTYTGARTAV